MVPGVGRVGFDERRIRHVVVRRRRQRLIAEQRRDEHDAVQLDAVALLDFLCETGRPDRAVRLTDQVLGRGPPAVRFQIRIDELAERAQVTRLPVELLVVDPGCHAAVAGVDGVDEHEIAHVDERVLVVLDRIGRGRLESLVRHPYVLRRERSHVQPDCRGARPAVVQERERTYFRLLTIFRVGDEEHSRGDLTVVEPNRQRAGGGGVLDLAPVDPDAVRCLRNLLFRRTGGFVPRCAARCARLLARRLSAPALCDERRSQADAHKRECKWFQDGAPAAPHPHPGRRVRH